MSKNRRPNAIRPVHDRRAMQLPRNATVGIVEIDDPFEKGAQILAIRSTRDDQLAAMRARNQIAEYQYQAGRHWQQLYRVAEVGRINSIDPERIRVDGGGARELGDRRRFRAIERLGRVRQAIGTLGDTILRDVLIAGMTLRGIAAARGLDTRAGSSDLIWLGRQLRECLDVVAKQFGYA